MVNKIVQRNFCANALHFYYLYISVYTQVPADYKKVTLEQYFLEKYIITPWNNSWIIKDSLKTIILRVVWLSKRTACTVHRMSLLSYQILCTYYIPWSLWRTCVIAHHLRFSGTCFRITEELWWTRLTRLLEQLANIPTPQSLSQLSKHEKAFSTVFTFSFQKNLLYSFWKPT